MLIYSQIQWNLDGKPPYWTTESSLRWQDLVFLHQKYTCIGIYSHVTDKVVFHQRLVSHHSGLSSQVSLYIHVLTVSTFLVMSNFLNMFCLDSMSFPLCDQSIFSIVYIYHNLATSHHIILSAIACKITSIQFTQHQYGCMTIWRHFGMLH